MAFPAEVGAFAHKVTGFFWSDLKLGVHTFLDFRFDLQFGTLKPMRDIAAAQHEYHGLALFKGDRLRAVSKSTRHDFDSPRRLGTARKHTPGNKLHCQNHCEFKQIQLYPPGTY